MSENNINITLIVEGCRRSNRNSQRKLFEHFFPYAMSICLRYAKNREEAEEILNNGFLKVFRFIDKYDTAYPFRIWLRKIMINTSVDYHRANHKHPSFLELKPSHDVEEEGMPMPAIKESDDMLPVLQQLSPIYRMVFNLYVMEGYKHDEIAEMLDISSSASRSNLVRAKNRLRDLLKKKERSSDQLFRQDKRN